MKSVTEQTVEDGCIHCAVLKRVAAIGCVLLLLVLASQVSAQGMRKASGQQGVSSPGVEQTQIESALAQSDWPALAAFLRSSVEERRSLSDVEPHLRFIAGHALLATGSNNLATSCFAYTLDKRESVALQEWKNWAFDLAFRHPDWSSAQYLFGDACARLGRLQEAVVAFDRALSLRPGDALVRNARAVVFDMLGVQDTARWKIYDSMAQADLQMATADTHLADAWVNLGVHDILAGFGPDHAIGNFEQALKRDSSFAMALVGRACARGAAGEGTLAGADLLRADSLCPGLPLVAENARSLAGASDSTSRLGRLGRSRPGSSKRGGQLKSWGVNATLGFPGIGSIGLNLDFDSPFRGGVYVALRDGQNLAVDEEGKPRTVGTWYVLNYPITESR
jgi:tetratricopeptide (TPR) repeat protein